MRNPSTWLMTVAIAAVAFAAAPLDAGTTKRESSSGNWSVTDDEFSEDFAYVMAKPSQNWTSGSGEIKDFEYARKMARNHGGPVLYVRIGKERLLIVDPETIDRVEEYMEPQELLGRQQGLLGRQQGRLGREQGRLGREQGQLGARQGALGARQARLSVEIQRAALDGRSTSRYERELDAVSREQSEIGRRQSELGEEQSRLGEHQRELGARQSELGEQQAELAREIKQKIENLVSSPEVRRKAIKVG